MKLRIVTTNLTVILLLLTSCGDNSQKADATTETTTQQVTTIEQTTVTQTESTENNSISKDDDIFYNLDIDELEKLANAGDAKAQFSLGRLYDRGEKVTQDYVKAFEWYSKAAKQGNNDAQYNLGAMYYHGDGIQQDYQKAFKWFSESAEQGDDYAQYALGLMYYKGKGIPQDKEKGLESINKAAEQGNKDAIKFLKKSEILAMTQSTTSNNNTTIDWDKCIQGIKDELINSDTGILDIAIQVDTTKEQINFSIVVDDTIEPEASLDIGSNVLRKFNSYVKEQDNSIKSDSDSSYGGLYDTYTIVIGISPLSEASNIDNWYVYDYIDQGTQGYIPLKLQKPYR